MSKGFAWLAGGSVAVMLLSALFRPAMTCCGGYGARRAAAGHLLAQFALAVESYEKAYGEYPPGDGRGTRDLLRALQPRRGRQQIFPESDPSEFVDGDLRNPIQPDAPGLEGVVRYRRNPPGAKPPYRLFLADGRGGELSEP